MALSDNHHRIHTHLKRLLGKEMEGVGVGGAVKAIGLLFLGARTKAGFSTMGHVRRRQEVPFMFVFLYTLPEVVT